MRKTRLRSMSSDALTHELQAAIVDILVDPGRGEIRERKSLRLAQIWDEIERRDRASKRAIEWCMCEECSPPLSDEW